MRNVLMAAGLAAGMAVAVALAVPAEATDAASRPSDKVAGDAASRPRDTVEVDVVTANGTGCPPGSTTLAVAPDNTAFTVTYSEYEAKVGPHGPRLVRRNCQLALDVHVPQGYTYAVAKADYRGFASLAKGATALKKASYYFQGDSRTVSASRRFTGPFEDNWQTTDRADVQAVVWAPCGETRYLNANTELRVDKGTSRPSATSEMTMDSTDVSVSTVFRLKWKKCPGR